MSGLLLGLDPSPSRIGWAYLDPLSGLPLDAGTFGITVEHEGWTFAQVSRGFSMLAAKARLLRREVTEVAVEDPFGPSKQQCKWNGEILGYVKSDLWAFFGVQPSRLYTPGEWKKACGLPGNATKDQVRVEAIRLVLDAHRESLNAGYLDQDACDAICIASALHMETRDEETT